MTVLAQDGGPDAVVLAMGGLDLSGSLTLLGTSPVILAVYGDATIGGTLSARSSTGQDAGAGAGTASLCGVLDGAPVAGVGSGGGAGGPGGGAVQLSASGTLVILGTVTASGAGGQGRRGGDEPFAHARRRVPVRQYAHPAYAGLPLAPGGRPAPRCAP